MGIELKEKNPGVLREKDISIQFPRGGGEVDLAQYVNDKQGSFFLRFDFEKANNMEINQKIFFISQNRKRKLDGIIHGSGCKSFFNVKAYVSKMNDKEGILLNTTQLRHLSVLGGTFLFANVGPHEIRMAQITFKDSKHPQYFCEPTPKKTPAEKEMTDESAESL
jgi:hypothetical protein